MFERGAGETLACGTGACAAVVAGIRRGLLDRRVDVETRGGALTIEWAGGDDAPVLMTGPAETVFEGEIELLSHDSRHVGMKASPKTTSPNYLANTPGFFERHAELLAAVQLTSPHGQRAVSLQERQMEMLREKIKGLEQQDHRDDPPRPGERGHRRPAAPLDPRR